MDALHSPVLDPAFRSESVGLGEISGIFMEHFAVDDADSFSWNFVLVNGAIFFHQSGQMRYDGEDSHALLQASLLNIERINYELVYFST